MPEEPEDDDGRSMPWGRPGRPDGPAPTPPPPSVDETVDLGAVTPPPTDRAGQAETAPLAPGPTGPDAAAPAAHQWAPAAPPPPPSRPGRTVVVAIAAAVVVVLVAAVAAVVVVRSGSGSGSDDGGGAAQSLEGRVIVVDPGHNGGNAEARAEIDRMVDVGGLTKACDTVGAEGGGQVESALTFDVAQRLRDELEARGARVVLTRPDDEGVGPCLDERARTAEAEGADVLLSIHADGTEAEGTGEAPSGFHVTSSPLSGEGSDVLAGDVRDGLVTAGLVASDDIGRDGVDVRRDFGTLNLSTVPSVVVDAGNMRSPVDQAVFGSGAGLQQIADGMADGAETFLAGR